MLCMICLTSCSAISKLFGGGKDTDDGTNDTDGENDPSYDKDDEEEEKNPPIPEGEELNITESAFKFFCTSKDELVLESFANLLYRVAKATGKQPEVALTEADADVLFGVADYTSLGARSVIGMYEIKMSDGKLYITADRPESLNLAKDRLLSYSTDKGIVISRKMNESALFNIMDYRTGKKTVYTTTDIANLTLLSEIKIDGADLLGFNPMKSSYSLEFKGEYPTVTASAINTSAKVDIDQASAENSGSAKITVSVGGFKRNYTVNFYEEGLSSVAAEIVVKGGAKGTICFVIDDGTESTAIFMRDQIFGKEGYENIEASFALITKKVADIHTATDEDGEPIYVIDENGKYEYTPKAGKFEFWQTVLDTGKAHLLSHTHTHTYEGDNDSGGVFVYKKNDGTYAETAYLPKGNVTMELVAANQIVMDIEGTDDSIALILPGVGAPHSGYFNSYYLDCGEYLIARGTAGSTSVIKDYNTIVYTPDELTDSTLRSVKSYMIEHFLSDPTGSTTSSSTNEECLAVGIQNWTDFMDTAIETGGWASFCIHEIRPDTYKGSDHHIYESQAKALFSYANSYGSDAWITSYNDAAKYYMEWGKTTVSSTLYDNKVIAVELETDITDARLDMELTVKIDIPESWAGATLGGEKLHILSDENGSYVLVDILPGSSVQITADGYDVKPDDGVALG